VKTSNLVPMTCWWLRLLSDQGTGIRFFLACLFLLTPNLYLSAQTISEESPLTFSPVLSQQKPQTVTLSPSDSGAAVFDVLGIPNRRVKVKVSPKKHATLRNGRSKAKITDYSFGGSVVDRGDYAIGTLDNSGRLNNIRVGATLRMPAQARSGRYSRILILQVDYKD